MGELMRLEDLSGDEKGVWWKLFDHMGKCASKRGRLSAQYEAELERELRSVCQTWPELVAAVASEREGSLLHRAARCARTDGLLRCVWECCGEHAPRIMRWRNSNGLTALMALAGNPNMTRGMLAVFVPQCTTDDLMAANNSGWTVLFSMACMLIRTDTEQALSLEQQESITSVMCELVQRLGADALHVQTTATAGAYNKGCSPHSILYNASDQGRNILRRLESAAAVAAFAASQAGELFDEMAPPHVAAEAREGETTSRSTATPAPATVPTSTTESVNHNVHRKLYRWLVRHTDIFEEADTYTAALIRAGIRDEAVLHQRFLADPSFLQDTIPVASHRTEIEQALLTHPAGAPSTGGPTGAAFPSRDHTL